MGGATIGEVNAELTLRLRQQELAAAFASFSLQTDALQPVLDEACRIAAKGMECVLAKVLEFLPQENCFIMRAGVGWHPGVVGHARLGSDLESPAGFAFQTGEPVLSNELGTETRFRTPRLLIDHGVRRAFNVLVHTPQQRFGVLEVDSPDQRDFTVADTAFLQTLAATLAHAIARQQRIDELGRSHAFARSMLDASPHCVQVLSADGTIRFMNHNGIEMNGFASLEAVRGREFAAMWPETGQEAIRHAIREAIAGRRTRFKGSCPTSAGMERWWELSFAPFVGDADDAVQIIAVSRDVSERRASDQALRNGERALRTLNETLEQRVEERTRERDRLWQLSEDLLVVANDDGSLVRISPSWTRVLGYDEATLLRTPYPELIHPDDVERVADLIDRMRRQERPGRHENRVVAADGG